MTEADLAQFKDEVLNYIKASENSLKVYSDMCKDLLERHEAMTKAMELLDHKINMVAQFAGLLPDTDNIH